jgi:hypothetical protein
MKMLWCRIDIVKLVSVSQFYQTCMIDDCFVIYIGNSCDVYIKCHL